MAGRCPGRRASPVILPDAVIAATYWQADVLGIVVGIAALVMLIRAGEPVWAYRWPASYSRLPDPRDVAVARRHRRLRYLALEGTGLTRHPRDNHPLAGAHADSGQEDAVRAHVDRLRAAVRERRC